MAEAGKKIVDYPTTHEKWVEGQNIPIIRSFSIPNLTSVRVEPWERTGAKGAYILLDGSEDSNDAYVLEIPGGRSTRPERHIYEEIFLVLAGRGATTVWNEGGSKRTFEWHEGSHFAMPPNAWHQHFNGQGNEHCLFYAVTTAPLVMNLFHNLDFVFQNNFVFTDRFNGEENFFSGEGRDLPGRVWETNFVEDVRNFHLQEWKERGAGGMNATFELGDGTMNSHISQFPVGTYKKAHRHGPGAHVIILSGHGYSLFWKNIGDEMKRVDWETGSVLVPAEMWFHQHFNTGATPARYFAIHWGSQKYPLLKAWSTSGRADVSVNEGGNQIEYEDEDHLILKIFQKELAKNDVEYKKWF